MTTEQPPDNDSVAVVRERREAITLFAADGIARFTDDIDPAKALDFARQQICRELICLGVTLEQQVEPSVMVLGQWVGGLIGTETTAEDEMARTMCERGKDLRTHLTTMIGWPRHAPIDELRERWAADEVTVN